MENKIFYIAEVDGDTSFQSQTLEIGSNIDFLPIVKINKDKEGVNCVFLKEDCENSIERKIELGGNFDENLRKYTVKKITIAKYSKSYIPIKNIKGYGGWFVDGDGELEFRCDNNKVKIQVFDESVPEDCGDKSSLYNLKDAELGDEYTLEISHTLGRGESFKIEVFAKDDVGLYDIKSDKIVKCGEFDFLVVERDVFLFNEKKDFIDENKNSLRNKTQCFIAVDKQFSKIIKGDENLVAKSYYNLNGYDRIKYYKKKEYVYSEKRFEQGEVWIRDNNLKPSGLKKGQEKTFSEFIKKGITNKIGYHIYYFVLLDAYHVLSIIVDNTLCKPKYIILDQLIERKWEDLDYLDEDLFSITERTYPYACRSVGRNDYNSSIQLWKLQR